jgi:hypothetical protein
VKLDELIDQRDKISGNRKGKNDGKNINNIKKLNTEISNIQIILEELSEKKAHLALRNYDYIDKHMRALDEQIRIVENAMKQNGYGDLMNKSSNSNSNSNTNNNDEKGALIQ